MNLKKIIYKSHILRIKRTSWFILYISLPAVTILGFIKLFENSYELLSKLLNSKSFFIIIISIILLPILLLIIFASWYGIKVAIDKIKAIYSYNSDVLSEKLFITIRDIKQISKKLLNINDDNYIPLEERASFLKQSIKDSESEILLICYSMTYWKDNIEESLREFLKKEDSIFKILMLMPDSRGFFEKSSIESFQYQTKTPTNQDEWLKSTNKTRDAHRKDIESSIETLVLWQEQFGKTKVDFRFYIDTPLLYGFSCDRKIFYISSFFINPIERGYRLPCYFIKENSYVYNNLLITIFLNWFDVKFATGFDYTQIR